MARVEPEEITQRSERREVGLLSKSTVRFSTTIQYERCTARSKRVDGIVRVFATSLPNSTC